MRPAKGHLQGQIIPSRRQGAKLEYNALAQAENLATTEARPTLPTNQIGLPVTSLPAGR